MKNKYSPFFAAYNTSVKRGNPSTKEDTIKDFTNGRTASLKELTDWELQELTRRLNVFAPNLWGGKADSMRKAIIAIFKSMEKTTEQAKAWAEKQGAKGNKKQFNHYTTGELYVLIQIAEKIKKDWLKNLRKSLIQ